MSLDAAHVAESLPAMLADSLGTVTVHHLERLKGGYSREMWSFDTVTRTAELPWILCTDSEEGVVGTDSLDRRTEAALLHTVHRAGVSVPDVIASGGADGTLGVGWYIMQRLPGTAAVGPLLRDPWYAEHRSELAQHKAQILAAIHAVPIPEGLLGPTPHPGDVAPNELTRWEAALALTPACQTPTLHRALQWLHHHLPDPPDRVTLVHGDYRTGNLIYDRTGITAILDWEMAHLGDPVEDLGWAQLVCWRLGTGRVGALVDIRDWPRLYEHAAGRGVAPSRLHFWEALCSVKMSVLAWRAFERTPDGPERELLLRIHGDLGHELDGRLLR